MLCMGRISRIREIHPFGYNPMHPDEWDTFEIIRDTFETLLGLFTLFPNLRIVLNRESNLDN